MCPSSNDVNSLDGLRPTSRKDGEEIQVGTRLFPGRIARQKFFEKGDQVVRFAKGDVPILKYALQVLLGTLLGVKTGRGEGRPEKLL